MNYKQQKKEAVKIKKTGLPIEEETKECPQCGEQNDTEAMFCAECGYNLQPAKLCPSCHSKVSPNADICENCGEWLLEGECKFCYADVGEEDAFCGECGNPVNGISCPQCGRLSIFDFCKSCHIPLSEDAKKMAGDAKDDPAVQELFALCESTKSAAVMADNKEGANRQRKELLKMKAYMSKAAEKEKKRIPSPLFSDRQREEISQKGKETEAEIIRIEEERRKAEEEERLRKEEEERKRLEKLLEEAAKKTFQTNQEARRYYNTFMPPGVRGWLCNFTGTIHSCPEDCGEPWHGGYWVV